MTSRVTHRPHNWHPYLFALYPVASLYATNAAVIQNSDLALSIVVVLILGSAIYALSRWLLSNQEKSAIAASWVIGSLFSYQLLHGAFNRIYHAVFQAVTTVPHEFSLTIWAATFLAGLVLIWKTKFDLSGVNRFLNSMSLVLLLITCLWGVKEHWGAPATNLTASADAWREKLFPLTRQDHSPDIYFLVFDRYASAQSLQDNYQFDNSSFIGSLQDRGLQVCENSRANYPRTILSMASALNGTYLPTESQSEHYYTQMIQDNAVCRSLRAIGYKYLHFGNWYQPLRSNKNADYVLPTSNFQSEFSDSLYAKTPFSKVWKAQDKYSFVTNKFKQIAVVANDPNPTFVYGHFLMPHPPFVFNSERSKRELQTTRYGDMRKNYICQLEATNSFVLETIDEILKYSQEPPVIILISDEGPYLDDDDAQLDRKSQILKRTGILTAYYLPETGGSEPVSRSISPVNTFRLVFNRYFEAGLEILPDRTFFWQERDELGRPAKANKSYVDVTDILDENVDD